MIDIHSHILHGLDDGAETLEESVAMVQMAATAGTTDIVASPHANQTYDFDPAVVEARIAELQAAVGKSPRIHFGCDFHLTPENIEDAICWPGKYSIDHRGYLLVEFSDFLIPKTTDEIFARLMGAGLRPVITHPERNQLLVRRVPQVLAWVEQGAYVQITAQSFMGRFGRTAKKVGEELMRQGAVHFVASDAHDLKWRPTALHEPRAYVADEFGEEAAVRVFEENPRACLAGVDLPAGPTPIKKRRRFLFW